MKRGKFITLDGIDGSGKSTQLEHLSYYLRATGKNVFVTREPGGTEFGEKIRDLVLDKNNDMSALTELMLMFAARAEHIEKILRPHVEAGDWVICSRFTDATIAYQGYGRCMEMEKIYALANLVHSDFNPDISFFLDLPAELAAERRNTRGGDADRIESEALEFMQSVRNGYLSIAQAEPNRCIIVDATLDVEEVAHQIETHINSV